MPKLALDLYLDHSENKVLTRFGYTSIIQLKNLRVLEIIKTDITTYQIREITIGANPRSAYASNLNTNDVIEKITRLSNT